MDYDVQRDIRINFSFEPHEVRHLLFKLTQAVKLQPQAEQLDNELIDLMTVAIDVADGKREVNHG